MPQPLNPAQLQQMEQEARQALTSGHPMDALDLYEDIIRRGWAKASHLTEMGHAYMKTRQRQDAKKAWLRAFAMDPAFQPAQQALDQFFPGWEEQASTSSIDSHPGRSSRPAEAHPAAAEPPPPPPPPSPSANDSGGGTLSMETIAPREPEPVVPPQPRPRAHRPQSPQVPHPPAHPVRPQPVKGEAPLPTRSNPAPAAVVSGAESKVNWDFVLADAATEAGAQKSRGPRH